MSNIELKSWESLKEHDDYEICITYPYQIRKKSTKRIIKESEDKQGYITCHLNLKTYKKHRLIAIQWIPNPKNLPDIDHINHIRSDNHIKNLRWVSKSQNDRNKAAYNKINVEYIETLPDDAIAINKYKDYAFEHYYYSKSTDKCYYKNEVSIRTLPFHTAPSGLKFIRALDVDNNSKCIYINAWLRTVN